MKKNIHSKNDKIRLFYFDNGNLGDILSGFLIENLTLRKVDLQYPITLSKFLKNLISFLITLIRYRGNYNLAKKGFTFSFKPTIIAIGSLIEHSTYTCKVWGTGMGQPRLIPSGGRFIMTRGYLSRHILMNAGFKVESHICGDPALLMPLLYNPFAKIIKNRGG